MILDGLSTRAALRSLRRARVVRRCRGRSDVFGNVVQAIFDREVPGLKPVRFCLLANQRDKLLLPKGAKFCDRKCQDRTLSIAFK
jgi:hypothetical protein